MLALLHPLLSFAKQQVVVGVSGGADSVALLLALQDAGALPVVAHLDHALRDDSAHDAAWVGDLARAKGLPFACVRVDIQNIAERRGWNTEDAARRVRYSFLYRVAKTYGAAHILTAHTQRDQAETVLMQLLRGEAVLSGIAGVRDKVKRPWLAVPRSEIEKYLVSKDQRWREDASNGDTLRTRAWIRHEVHPMLRERFPAIDVSLARVARWQGEDQAALVQQASQLTPHTPLASQPAAVLRRRVVQLLGEDISYHAGHIQTLAEALSSGKTKHVTLPASRHVTVTAGKLYVGSSPSYPYTSPEFAYPPGWTLRTRQNGDYIRLSGGTRKLSDVLTDYKVPRTCRDQVPLLADHQAVQWIGLSPALWALSAREQTSAAPDSVDEAMKEALSLARQALDMQEVPVGAVVLGPQNQVIGRGHNTSRQQGDMTRHAELSALQEAVWMLGSPYLVGCTLVVTLEPCPMCLGAALEARVQTLVYAAKNLKSGALGGVADLLTVHWGHQLSVISGVRAREAAVLLQSFFKSLHSRDR